MHNIVLDTDIGTDIDDALALLLAIKSPEISIKAVTTVYGDVEKRAKIARKMLDAGGLPDVPVAAGESTPLTKNNAYGIWHTGLEGRGILTESDLEKSVKEMNIRKDGVDTLINGIKEGDAYLVTIGALTNAAKAILKAPEEMKKVKHIYIMGGAVRFPHLYMQEESIFEYYPGRMPEYNIACDPDAARIVFESGLPITMVGLDVTVHAKIYRNQLEDIRSKKTELTEYIGNMFDEWMNYLSARHGRKIESTSMHDPLTLGIMLNEGKFVDKTAPVKIEIDEYGRTNPVNTRGNVQICYNVRPDLFMDFYMDVCTK